MAALEPTSVTVPLRLGSVTLVTSMDMADGRVEEGQLVYRCRYRHRWRLGRVPVPRWVAHWVVWLLS